MKKIGLAMGGGGAKGLAHLGILKILEKEKIKISAIAGTSMGAIIGGLYALEPDIDLIEKRILDYFCSIGFAQKGEKELTKDPEHLARIMEQSIQNLPSLLMSFLDPGKSDGPFGALIPEANIEETKIPFAALACDLKEGKDYIFRTGPLKRALSASSTVPGIWPPVEFEGKYLVDGGLTTNVPVDTVKELGAEKVIAIDVRPNLEDPLFKKGRIDVLVRTIDIQQYYLAETHLKKADIVIRPELHPIFYTDFSTVKICIALGEKAAKIHLKDIKAILK